MFGIFFERKVHLKDFWAWTTIIYKGESMQLTNSINQFARDLLDIESNLALCKLISEE